MREYVVKSKLEDKEWQIANQVRDHVFVCDAVNHDLAPDPVEYRRGIVNSFIEVSAMMNNKEHKLDIRIFGVENKAITEIIGDGKSEVTEKKNKVFFDSAMTSAEYED